MDPEEIMYGISDEIVATLHAMKKAKTADERLKHSEIMKNLCQSLGVFLDLASDIAPFDDEDEAIPF